MSVEVENSKTRRFVDAWREKAYIAKERRFLVPAEEKRYDAYRNSIFFIEEDPQRFVFSNLSSTLIEILSCS